jgi:hypothetical protein
MSIDLLTATAADLQSLLQQGTLTSRSLVDMYLQQIAKYNDYLKAVIATAPIEQLHARAEGLDRERIDGALRGPLHGIPIFIKVGHNVWEARFRLLNGRRRRITLRQDRDLACRLLAEVLRWWARSRERTHRSLIRWELRYQGKGLLVFPG